MKVKLYNFGEVIEVVDCNDIDHIDNPCYFDDVICVHLRNHETRLCNDLVFLTEEESQNTPQTIL